MKGVSAALLLIVSGVASASAATIAPADTPLADSTSVALGYVLGRNATEAMQGFKASGIIIDDRVVVEAMTAVISGQKPAFDADAVLNNVFAQMRKALPERCDSAEQQRFVEVAAARPGARQMSDGLVVETLTPGTGASPTAQSIVRVHYVGELSDGTVFDDTTAGSPIELKVADVTKGFGEGLLQMQPGGSYRLTMPASLAYGEEGIGGVIPGNAALQFTVQLIEIK